MRVRVRVRVRVRFRAKVRVRVRVRITRVVTRSLSMGRLCEVEAVSVEVLEKTVTVRS